MLTLFALVVQSVCDSQQTVEPMNKSSFTV